MFLHTYWVHGAPYDVGDLVGIDKRLFAKKELPDVPLTRKEVYSGFSEKLYELIIRNNKYRIVNDDVYKQFKAAGSFKLVSKLFYSLTEYQQQEYYGALYFENLSSDKEHITYARDLYDELIFYLDRELKNLIINYISKKTLGKNTIVIITADHGEEFMEHGATSHPSDHIYDSTVSIPLIMYIPGVKHVEVSNLVQSVDLFPTVLNLIGIFKTDHLDGTDLTNLIKGDGAKNIDQYLIGNGTMVDSIRNKNWKLYVRYNKMLGVNKYELYNLNNDPGEKDNLSQTKSSIVENLKYHLNMIIYKK